MRRKRRLVDTIGSDYLEAASALRKGSPTFVYVEGYDDIAFWRNIFDEYEGQGRTFEISTPDREDMAKGKKVVLTFAKKAGEKLLLCVDSDFDRLLDGATFQSNTVNENKYVIQTGVYAIENLLCLPQSLGSIATKATKNGMQIFDFVDFAEKYSETLYPLFLWYFYTAKEDKAHIITLSELKNCAKIDFLDFTNNGKNTLDFVKRQVSKKLKALEENNPNTDLTETDKYLKSRGVIPKETHLYIQGHFWKDNVSKPLLSAVCKNLRDLMMEKISHSKQNPQSKRNDLSSYNNSLVDIERVIEENTYYKNTKHYEFITSQLQKALV